MVRGLQRVLGSSKRAMVERAEEMGDEDDAIPLTEPSATTQASDLAAIPIADMVVPEPTRDPSSIRGTSISCQNPASSTMMPRISLASQAPLPLTRPQRWATFINFNFDIIVYMLIFVFGGLPTYYGAGYGKFTSRSLFQTFKEGRGQVPSIPAQVVLTVSKCFVTIEKLATSRSS